MDKQTSNIVLIVLALIGGLAVIWLLGMWVMGATMMGGGMMGGTGATACCGGMGLWIPGLLLFTVIVIAAVLLILRR